MQVEPETLLDRKEEFRTNSGKIITVKAWLIRLPGINKKEYPNDYKFSLMAFNKDNAKEQVRLDNHENRPPHYHWDQNPIVFFEWKSWLKTRQLFSQLVFKRFGKIIK